MTSALGTKLKTPADRLRKRWPFIVQATLTATIGWVISHSVLHHEQPFFAPVAAVIVLTQARGGRKARLVEILLGVAGGVLLGDALVHLLGAQQTSTIFAVILITLTAAVMFGASPVTTIQATISAVFLVVIPPAEFSDVPSRFIDALIGGGAGLLVSQLSALRNPVAPLIKATNSLFDELHDVLREVSGALDRGDEGAAREALVRARRADEQVDAIRAASSAAGEAVWLHLHQKQHRSGLQNVESVEHHIDYFVRNVRVLARSSVALTRQSQRPWPTFARAASELADSLHDVKSLFEGRLTGELASDTLATSIQARALEAVTIAGSDSEAIVGVAPYMVIGQIRSTALDLMRLTGADDQASLDQVDQALGMPSP